MSGKINVLSYGKLSKKRCHLGGKSLTCIVRYDGEPLNNLSLEEKAKLEEAWCNDDINGDIEHACLTMKSHAAYGKRYHIELKDYYINNIEKE
jgi:hypothetical protein